MEAPGCFSLLPPKRHATRQEDHNKTTIASLIQITNYNACCSKRRTLSTIDTAACPLQSSTLTACSVTSFATPYVFPAPQNNILSSNQLAVSPKLLLAEVLPMITSTDSSVAGQPCSTAAVEQSLLLDWITFHGTATFRRWCCYLQ